MRYLKSIIVGVLVLCSSVVYSAAFRNVNYHVEWAYPTDIQGINHFEVIKDGNIVATPAVTERTADLPLDYHVGDNTFTMTVVDDEGNKSLESDPFVLTAKVTDVLIKPSGLNITMQFEAQP